MEENMNFVEIKELYQNTEKYIDTEVEAGFVVSEILRPLDLLS